MAEIFIRKETKKYQPKYDRTCVVARFWQERKSGDIFEVVAHRKLVNEGYHRIVLHPQKCPLPDAPNQCSAQSSMFEHDLIEKFQQIGNIFKR